MKFDISVQLLPIIWYNDNDILACLCMYTHTYMRSNNICMCPKRKHLPIDVLSYKIFYS